MASVAVDVTVTVAAACAIAEGAEGRSERAAYHHCGPATIVGMTPLMPCPRCTQALPVTAGFCRRCGLPVQRPVTRIAPAPQIAPPGRRRTGPVLVLGGGVAIGVLLLFAGTLVRMTPAPVVMPAAAQGSAPAQPAAGAQPTADPPAPTPPTVVQVLPPSPPPLIYQLPVPSRYPPSITVPPGYHMMDDNRHDDDDRYRKHR